MKLWLARRICPVASKMLAWAMGTIAEHDRKRLLGDKPPAGPLRRVKFTD
jgi:hypothetical protein